VKVLAAVVAALATVGGCASPPPVDPRVAHVTQVQAERPLEMPCPLGVSDAAIVAEETDEGIAVIVVSPAQPEELRRRVTEAAKLHGPMAHRGLGHDGPHGHGRQHGLHLGSTWPPAIARVLEIPGGARLELVPVDAVNRDGLRGAIRERVVGIASTPCAEP
jgi:hypothetical protein